MKKVLLLGAGHAQLSVLQALAQARLAGGDVLLVTPYPRQLYSGMVPGLIAGRFGENDCAIDVMALARAAGVHFRLGQAVALDAASRQVTLADGERIGYDVLSINTGPVQDRDRIPGAREHALFVRPIESFIALWPATRALADERPLSVVLIGGGAAGVELALAVRAALGARAEISLVAEGGLLTTYPARVRERAARACKRARVQVLPGRVSAIERRHVVVGDAMRIVCDVPLIATGSNAPSWLAGSGLALDERGFVRVGATLQSASHANVLAAGDIIVRDDAPHPRSGVYAVRAGPVLAANLRAVVAGGTPAPYVPQTRSLNLLSTGDGRAIANWGAWSAQGWLMGWWKDRIDRAFIARFRQPDAMPASAARSAEPSGG
jgi:pyridine nucleotide-disulfide oxidoreductase family protein